MIPESGAGPARYRIGTVARMVGITTHALRAWERRYDALAPERTEAGGRLYTDADVARLRLIKSLLAYGHSISNVARLDVSELSGLLDEHRVSQLDDTRSETFVKRYLDSIEALDVEGAEQVLLRATAILPPFEVVQKVIVPVLEHTGSAWEAGEFCVAQEHAATALVRGHLSGLLRTLQPKETEATCIATTPAGELHELGALMAALLAAMRRHRSVYLGPNLPASEIADAARRSGAQRVLLSIVSLSKSKAEAELAAIAEEMPAQSTVLVGGRRVPELDLPEGFVALDSLDALDAHLSEP